MNQGQKGRPWTVVEKVNSSNRSLYFITSAEQFQSSRYAFQSSSRVAPLRIGPAWSPRTAVPSEERNGSGERSNGRLRQLQVQVALGIQTMKTHLQLTLRALRSPKETMLLSRRRLLRNLKIQPPQL